MLQWLSLSGVIGWHATIDAIIDPQWVIYAIRLKSNSTDFQISPLWSCSLKEQLHRHSNKHKKCSRFWFIFDKNVLNFSEGNASHFTVRGALELVDPGKWPHEPLVCNASNQRSIEQLQLTLSEFQWTGGGVNLQIDPQLWKSVELLFNPFPTVPKTNCCTSVFCVWSL